MPCSAPETANIPSNAPDERIEIMSKEKKKRNCFFFYYYYYLGKVLIIRIRFEYV